MSFSERKLQRLCMNRSVISTDSTKMERAVSGAKAAYYAWEENSTLSRGEFILQQAKFIKKRWWILQALVLVGLWAILKYGDSTYPVQRSIGLFAPLFALLILPEIWKNRTADAMEVECTARFSLRQIYAGFQSIQPMQGNEIAVAFALTQLQYRLGLVRQPVNVDDIGIDLSDAPFQTACIQTVYSVSHFFQIMQCWRSNIKQVVADGSMK